MIFRNSTPILFLLDLCQKLNFAKRYTTKWKNRSHLTGGKKKQRKYKRYLLLECKIIKTLLFEKEEQIKEEGPNPYTLV